MIGHIANICLFMVLMPAAVFPQEKEAATPTAFFNPVNKFEIADDGTALVEDTYILPYGNSLIRGIWLCANGIVSLGKPTSCSPSATELDGQLPYENTIYPFWGDIDVTYDLSPLDNSIYVDNYYASCATQDELDVLQNVSLHIQENDKFSSYEASFAMIITWNEVMHYGKVNSKENEVATFQLIITSNGNYSYAIIIYKDGMMGWDKSFGNVNAGINVLNGSTSLNLGSDLANDTKYAFDQVKGNVISDGYWLFLLSRRAVNPHWDKCYGQCCKPKYEQESMFPFKESLQIGDDESILVNNEVEFPLDGKLVRDLYICSNGLMTVGNDGCSFVSSGLGGAVPEYALAPFWADINPAAATNFQNRVFYDSYSRSCPVNDTIETLDDITARINAFTGNSDFNATFAAMGTWDAVVPFGIDDQDATFQSLLVTNGTMSYGMFIYLEKGIHWKYDARNVTVGVHFGSIYESLPMLMVQGLEYYSFGDILGNTGKLGSWIFALTGEVENPYAGSCIGKCCSKPQFNILPLYPFFSSTGFVLDSNASFDQNVSIPYGDGQLSNGFHVCSHGYFTLGGSSCEWDSSGLGGSLPPGFSVAPYWADINLALVGQGFDNELYVDRYYGSCPTSFSDEIIEKLSQTIGGFLKTADFRVSYAAVMTWHEVLRYRTGRKPTTFQAVLATDGARSFVLFLYKNASMTWARTSSTPVTVGTNHGSTYESLPMAAIDERESYPENYAFDRIFGNTFKHGFWFFELTNGSVANEQINSCIGDCCTLPEEGLFPSSPHPVPLIQDQMLLINQNVTIPFNDKLTTGISVCANGYIALGSGVTCTFNSRDLGGPLPQGKTVVPYWSDIDITRQSAESDNRVYVEEHTTFCKTPKGSIIIKEVDRRIGEIMASSDFKANYVLVATWNEILSIRSRGEGQNNSATFQAVVASNGTQAFAMLLYKPDHMMWDRGAGVIAGVNLATPVSLQMSELAEDPKYRFDQVPGNAGNGAWIYALNNNHVNNPFSDQCIGHCCEQIDPL